MNKNENLIDIETPPNQENDINNNNNNISNNSDNKNIESLSEQISTEKLDLNKDNDEGDGSSGGESDKSEKKKKKKKKKEKKKNKKAAAAAGNTTDEDIPGDGNEEVIIKSPILLKRMRNNNDDDHQYSTEMTHFDSPLDGRGNNNDGSGTPQIEVDPEMYFDGRKKEKKKKLKKQNGEGGGNKDKFLTPEERRIKENSKDAKSFFSNERTFLSWIGLTFSLGAIGTAIITWFGSEGVSLATGVFLWAIAMVFMVYSTLQFRRRGHAIRTKTQGPFDDQKGPLSLVAMVVVGVSIYLVFFVVIRPTVNIGNDVEPSSNSTKN